MVGGIRNQLFLKNVALELSPAARSRTCPMSRSNECTRPAPFFCCHKLFDLTHSLPLKPIRFPSLLLFTLSHQFSALPRWCFSRLRGWALLRCSGLSFGLRFLVMALDPDCTVRVLLRCVFSSSASIAFP